MTERNQGQQTSHKDSRKYRKIFDAASKNVLPGKLVRIEGDPPSEDVSVNEVYDALGTTYDFFWEKYNRDSFDAHGAELLATVHYQKGYSNAFWNGAQLIFGDGDSHLPENQRLFNRFSVSMDILANQLTKGIIQFSAQLAYWDQPGALNESMSDIFGTLVKQYYRQETVADANWIVGEGLFSSNVKAIGLRSLKAPGTAYDDPMLGKDPQPSHMKDYVKTTSDNGGVHINSGIPNHAFYLIAMELGGYAWEKAGLIWYRTLTEKLQDKSDFQDAANQTFQMAGKIFGSGSKEQQTVRMGWENVGINATKPSPRKGFRFFRRNK